MSVDLCELDAVRLAEMMRSRTISAVDVLDSVQTRIESLEPTLHAFCTLTLETAREDAKRLDASFKRGDAPGRLAGVPVAIKDLVCTKGVRTACGSPAYEDFVPDEDDIVVERLREAGAIILGKTNVPEFGYSGAGHNPIFETTRNPWNISLTSGGSSAGSAVAVATGMGPFAIGSDGGGSIRIPAAHCGIVGVKASMGRVPLYPGCRDERYPGVSSWESIEHIGPLSRTVGDAALMLSVIAGPDHRDRHSVPTSDIDWTEATQGGVRGLKVAYSSDWGYAAVDAEVRDVVERAVRVFERELGCVVVKDDPGWADPLEAFWNTVAMDTDLRGMKALMQDYGDRMSPHLVEFICKPWTAEDFTDAIVARKAIYNKAWKFMQNYDFLLTPTLATPPFALHMQGPERIDGRMVSPSEWLAFTFPINLTGQPAASVPAGFTSEKLPVGLQIVGRHLDDRMVLRAAAAFEEAAPWRDRWPPMVADVLTVDEPAHRPDDPGTARAASGEAALG